MKSETTLVQLAEGIWALEQEMVRSYLVVGSTGALLLDTGAIPCDLPGLIRSVTDLPVTVVQTHGDGDHTANSSYFPELYAHPAELDVIYRFRPELPAKIHPVTEGDTFDLGGRTLEVIEAPGHTPGSICLLDRTNRILFSGDTVSYGPVFLFGDHRDIHTYRKTLEKLQALEVDTVYPCHNTAPVSLSIIPALMEAVDGTLEGRLQGVPTEMPMPDGLKPLCYSVGQCGILYL